MKVVIDKNIPFINGVLEPYAEVVYMKGDMIDKQTVVDADALIVRTRTRCNADLLEGSSVKIVSTATIGFDHVDVPYLASQGIEFTTAAGCNAAGVLQYVMTALVWLHDNRKAFDVANTTLGVIGVGNVGSLVADFAERCGFKVLRCDPPRQRREGGDFVDRDYLLANSDIVTCHVPLNREGEDKTFGMADEAFFARMPKGSLFINSSRGEVVVDEHLCQALKSGHIHSAVIDTWNNEPAISSELLSLASLTTPHIAGYSLQGKANGSSMVVQAVARKFDLPLKDWYPDGVARRPKVEEFDWQWLYERALTRFDIEAQTDALKSNPEQFESMRNNYDYREEYF